MFLEVEYVDVFKEYTLEYRFPENKSCGQQADEKADEKAELDLEVLLPFLKKLGLDQNPLDMPRAEIMRAQDLCRENLKSEASQRLVKLKHNLEKRKQCLQGDSKGFVPVCCRIALLLC
jgi:hypothetical protein